MKLRLVLLALCAAMFTGESLLADEGPVIIRNRYQEIHADRATGRLTFYAHGKPVLTDVAIGDESGRPTVELGAPLGIDVGDSSIGIEWPNKSRTLVGLRAGKRFAEIITLRTFSDARSLAIHNEPVFQATVAGNAADYKVLGTGGLTKPGKRIGSYMWLAAAKPGSRSGIVAGFRTTERGSGVIFAESKDDRLQISARVEFGKLAVRPKPPGEQEISEASEVLAIGYFDDVHDGLEAWADMVAEQYDIKLPPQPSGYCTWYHAGPWDEKALVKQTEIAAKELKPYGFDFLQIDDGWQDGEAKNGSRKNFTRVLPNGPYKSGMKQTADMIRGHGLTPGIWLTPFAGTWNDPWFKDHQDWFVHKADGSPYDTDWGGTCLDMTNPDARKYVADNVRRITHDWDYEYLKLDALWTGSATVQQYINTDYKDDHMGDAVFHDKTKTNIEALRSGLKLVREAAGPGVFLLGCCAPQNMRSYGGAFGLVDAMRVGPDNAGDLWESVLTSPRFASRHYHLNGRIWYNDPDVVYVRNSLTLDQARADASWVSLSGQLFVVSDDFSKLTSDRLEVLKRTMAAHGRHVRPVDLLDEEIPRMWLVSDVKRASGSELSSVQTKGSQRNVLGLFNWDGKKPWDVDYPLDRTGLPAAKRYVAFDFWGNRLLPPMEGRLKATLPPSSCLILAMRPESDHPQLLSTSRHITQGMIDVSDEQWDAATNSLSGTSKLVPGDEYELRIAAGKGWKAAGVESNIESLKPAIASEEGLVRVRVTVPVKEAAEWHWKITFSPPTPAKRGD